MHIAILIIAIILVGGGILVRNKTIIESPPKKDVVLGESTSTSTPTPSVAQTPSHTPTNSQPPPTPSLVQSSSSNLADFIYPNATIELQTSKSLNLKSSSDAQLITDWYKNKIKDLGMNTRSFVQTKTNDNVKNVLAAAKNSDEVKVTITKNAGESLVSIVVER